MSERIEQIMKEYNVGLEEAFDIMDRQTKVMTIIFEYIEPYGKHLH